MQKWVKFSHLGCCLSLGLDQMGLKSRNSTKSYKFQLLRIQACEKFSRVFDYRPVENSSNSQPILASIKLLESLTQ